MTGPRAALALAHRRMVCGVDARADRLDREDLEVADGLARLLADQGYEITRQDQPLIVYPTPEENLMPHTVTLNIKATYDDATYEMAVSQLFGKGLVGPLSKEDVVDMIESTVDDSELSVEVTPA